MCSKNGTPADMSAVPVPSRSSSRSTSDSDVVRFIDAFRPEISSAAIEVRKLLIRRNLVRRSILVATVYLQAILSTDYLAKRNKERGGFFSCPSCYTQMVRDTHIPDQNSSV